MAKIAMEDIIKVIPSILNFPVSEFWVDYDREADVLYISFQHPQKATDTEILDNGILVRYRDQEPVGVTVINASSWLEST